MSASDSKGSIQQPLMDLEVISIGDSSLEDTLCGASNNESSSLEKLRDLRHTGRGTSRLSKKAQPFATSPAREPIPVTVALPLFASRGARRSSGDIRVSPRVRRSHSVGSPSSSPAVVGYE